MLYIVIQQYIDNNIKVKDFTIYKQQAT